MVASDGSQAKHCRYVDSSRPGPRFRCTSIPHPITFRDNSSNSIFVSFVIFLVCFCARGANGIDHEIVLMRKDRAQIEFEATAGDVANDRRTGTAKSTHKIIERGVLGQKVDRD